MDPPEKGGMVKETRTEAMEAPPRGPLDPGARSLSVRARFWHPRFGRELVLVTVLYFAYELVADVTAGSRATALGNALAEVHLEQALGIFEERAAQTAVLQVRWLIETCNDYYATVHFVMPVVVLLWLWWRFPARYRQWRNALAWLTAISLVVFVFFPVMPPRLLPHSYGFVDTMRSFGGAGHLDDVLLTDVGDPYAAMPSLHVAWALWCAVAMYPTVRNRWLRALLVADPIVTTFVVIVTANHFFLDVVAGVVVVMMGAGLAKVRWAAVGLRVTAAIRSSRTQVRSRSQVRGLARGYWREGIGGKQR